MKNITLRMKSRKISLKDNCEKCGSKKNLLRHHFDYNKVEFMTLCHSCHTKWHNNNETIENLDDKAKEFIIRLDKKLWEQLARYSQSNDLSIAQSARRAIKLFLKENK